MHKVMQNKLTKSLIILPIFGIIVLSFLYINIYINATLANSHAINDTDSYNFNLADTTNLSISLPAPETLTLTPSAEGVFGSKSIAVGVSTNSPYGYTLTMSAASSSLSRSAAVGGVTPTIPALETAVSEADFPSNYWGFKRTSTAIADTNYQPMLANHSVLVNNTSANADSSSSTITFGVKLSNETPSGDYSINIDFLAVTNVAPNLYYMQDATSTSLAAAMPSVGDTTVLYDRRDNQEYTIAKLADGKYWMTKNLNLAGGTPLYSSDSDVPAGYDAAPYYTLPESSTTTTENFVGIANFDNTDCNNGNPCYSYYSYPVATANSYTSNMADGSDAPYSICPRSWILPRVRDYSIVVSYYDTPAKMASSPFESTYNGRFFERKFGLAGSRVNYWTSTSTEATPKYSLHISKDGSIFEAGFRANINNGYGVRCLFDDTMQSFSSDYASALAMEETVTLHDVRDDQEYTVAKLKDGNVWMTKNLNLAGGTTLTRDDSDLTNITTYTLPANSTTTTTGFDSVANSGNEECGSNTPCYSYYSNFVSTAGTSSGISKDGTDAPSSICPKNWKLPSKSTFAQLTAKYDTVDKLTSSPVNIVFAGYYNRPALDSVFYHGGDSAMVQSATTYTLNATYRLGVGKNSQSPDVDYTNNKNMGMSIRCILR